MQFEVKKSDSENTIKICFTRLLFEAKTCITTRAVERAWKAWQFHGARGWKGGPQITKTKEKWDNQKKLSHFGP
jgi:hypothetical protein